MPHTRTPDWARGMRKLGPGIYLDSKAVMHVSERELCEHFNVPYTAANVRIIEETLQASIKREFGKEIPTNRVTHEAD